MKGLLLDKDGDIRIVPHKGKDGLTGFVIGDTLIQNAATVLELNQGELKEDPVLGANLIRYIRSQADKRAIEKQMKIHLKRAGIDYSAGAGLLGLRGAFLRALRGGAGLQFPGSLPDLRRNGNDPDRG